MKSPFLFSKYKSKIEPNIFWALSATFLYSLGFASVIFLPAYLHIELQHTIMSTGVAMSVYGVGSVIASYYGGKLCDSFSAKNISIISLIFSIVSLSFIYLIKQPYWLIMIFLVFLGMSNSAFLPASRIYLMRFSAPDALASINGIRYTLYNTGCAVSLSLASWITGTHFKRIFLIGILINFFSLLTFVFGCNKEKIIHLKNNLIKSKLLNDKFLLGIMLCFFFGMLVFSQFNSIFSLFLFTNYHISAHQLGTLFTINCLMIVLLQIKLLGFFKSISQPFLMVMGSFVLGIGFFILLFSHHFWLAILSTVIITLGEMMFMPVSQNVVFQNAKEGTQGYHMGIYQTLCSIALIVSPFLGSLALKINPQGVLLWSISLGLCTLPLAIYFYLRKVS